VGQTEKKSTNLIIYSCFLESRGGCNNLVSTSYQAWVSAMEEVTKNGSTDSSKWILTLCINLVSTSVRGYQILEEIRLI
jgi:hypothetical protein